MNLGFGIIINLFVHLVSSSNLIVFREGPKLSNVSTEYPQQESRRLMCISDNPNNPIVWNTNWFDSKFKNADRREWKAPELSKYPTNYEQQCVLNVDDEECLSSWSKDGAKWNMVHSYDVPMGPVYDSRWEDFTDFNSHNLKPITTTKTGVNSTLTFGLTGSIAFSIRGRARAQIGICESEDYKRDFCYTVTIGNSYYRIITIEKCTHGMYQLVRYAVAPCQILTEYRTEHDPLSFTEWKTFVLTWEERTRTIELFDPDKKIISYSDHNSTYRNSNKLYHIFYGNLYENMEFRFHDYSYTLTTDPGATLRISPVILDPSQELCIDMVVGLCKHCGLILNFLNGSGRIRAKKRVRRSYEYDRIEHDLPMWQNERIKVPHIPEYSTLMTLEVKTFVVLEETDSTRDHWAITKVQHCLPKETDKLVKTTAYQDCKASNCFWSDSTCQSLSYDDPKSAIVEAIHTFRTYSNNFENCLDYSIGPNCAIKCDSFFQHNCYGVQVCTKNGCSCAQGWQGSNCTTKCSAGSYGFGCSRKCNNCTDDSCDNYTGKCNLGCKSTLPQIRVPPFCNIVIEPLSVPLVGELKETSVRVSLYKEEAYKTINATLEFEVKAKSGNILKKYARGATDYISNPPKNLYYANFDGLSAGEKYSVKATTYILTEDHNITQAGESSATFLTPCNWDNKFEIIPGERSLTIKKISKEGTYSCPDSWYSVDLSIMLPATNESQSVNISNSETYFPITLSELHPFTKYQVCVNGRDNRFQICQMSSPLEPAPSPVTNFQIKSTRADGAEVIWSSPDLPNSIILGYNLTIKVSYYIGCNNKENTPEDLKFTNVYPNIAPATEVSYNLTDLVPYVTYEVTVVAFNSRIGNESSLTFSTKPRDIPTEVFTNIRLSHNDLTWDNPVDCWTITGPIEGSRVIITGVSEDVQNFSHSYDIKSRSLNLKMLEMYGYEMYQAKVYVLHEPDKSINITAYIDVHFTTDSSLPPKVPNLAIVVVDESTTTLKWQKPLPPIYGELDFYRIRFLGRNGILLNKVEVYLNETCYLWKNSICKTPTHPPNKVVETRNEGVNNPFLEKPEIISITEVDKGVIYLEWKYPSSAGGLMEKFLVFSLIVDSELEHIPSQDGHQAKVVPINKHKSEYSTYLYLLPSTRYAIFIQGMTSTHFGTLSTKIIETNSALDFQYKPRSVLDNDTFLINIIIPPVVNNTKDSQLHIIVKGPGMCINAGRLSEQMIKDIQLEYFSEYHGVLWRVATFPTYQTANLLFTIGDDHIYDTVSNCPLTAGNSYFVILLVHEKMHQNMNKTTRSLIWKSESIQVIAIPNFHHELWAIPLILVLLGIAVTMYYCLHRRRNSKYFDKKRGHGLTEPISIHPIVAETKKSQSSNCPKLLNQAIVTENVYEEILNTVDAQGSILKAQPNFPNRINETIATESKYDDVADVQKPNSQILPNSPECINRTVTTEPIYLELIDTVE